MLIKTKIDLRKYLLLSILPTGICFAFARDIPDAIAIVIIYLTTIINQVFLIKGVDSLINSRLAAIKTSNFKIVCFFLIKMSVLILGLAIGIKLMGNRVIIPLINYVIMIFILVASLNKKKG